MKLIGLAALAAVLAAGCDVLDGSAKEKALEAKVADLEKRLADSESKRAQQTIDQMRRRTDMEECLSSAEDAYWQYVKLNGRPKKSNPDIWLATADVWNQASQEKRNVIEACRVRFAQN